MKGTKKIGFEYVEELDVYLKDVQDIRILTKNEEYELARRIQNGDRNALNKLVYHNLRFVIYVAKKYRSSNVPFPDLISEGNLGLIKAAEKFDPEKNVRFATYAMWWIKASLNDCVNAYKKPKETVSLDVSVIDNRAEVERQLELINENFEERINKLQSQKDAVDALLKCLHDREKQILILFYGLNGGREMTLDEVGKQMQISNERVRQIKDTALCKLKCKALTYSAIDMNEFKSLR